jgi:hypothetical protein
MSEDFGEDTFPDDETHPAGPEHSHEEPDAELVYDSAIEFFAELLAPSYVRDVNEGASWRGAPSGTNTPKP